MSFFYEIRSAGRVAKPLGVNFRVAAPSWFFEGAEGFDSISRLIV